MTATKGQIKNIQIFIAPSQKLHDYIKNIKLITEDDAPVRIKNIAYKNKVKDDVPEREPKLEYLITKQDQQFISSLQFSNEELILQEPFERSSSSRLTDKLLSLQDLHWLHAYIQRQNKVNTTKLYLFELIKGSEVILPKNEEIPRNEELEKRCQRLKAEQQNREYQNMTKNVDGFRRRLPEDTLSYQMKMMNKHLIAVFQFVVTVLSGFAFGFSGIHLLVGEMEFVTRLMLGIGIATIFAIADLYFLLKQLNQDMEYENIAKRVETIQEKKVN